MKIVNLYELERLNKKATLLLNMNIDNEFYDNFMFNEIEWLVKNEEKINNDFLSNIENLEFGIITSDLNERNELIKSLHYKSVEEFCKYISYIPYSKLNKEIKNEINLKFSIFKSIKDEYNKINYFDRIRRS